MRIGVMIGGEVLGQQVDLKRLFREAYGAEERGFASVWVPHISGVDAIDALAIVEWGIRRIELGNRDVDNETSHARGARRAPCSRGRRRGGTPRAPDRGGVPDRGYRVRPTEGAGWRTSLCEGTDACLRTEPCSTVKGPQDPRTSRSWETPQPSGRSCVDSSMLV